MACAVPFCKSVKRFKPINTSFHQLPQEKALLREWLQLIGKDGNLNWKATFFVCSKHFTEDDYLKVGDNKRILKGTSKPSLLIPERDETAPGSFRFVRGTLHQVQTCDSSSRSHAEISSSFKTPQAEAKRETRGEIVKPNKRKTLKSAADSSNTESSAKRRK